MKERQGEKRREGRRRETVHSKMIVEDEGRVRGGSKRE